MPYEIEGTVYYTVNEVAKKIARTSQTLKRWEKAGKIPEAGRLKANNWRVYSGTQVTEIEKYSNSVTLPSNENTI